MTDDAHKSDDHGDHGATVKMYLTVFVALAIFTLVSFVANYAASGDAAHPAWISKFFSFVIILTVAVVKAGLVGWIFMHLGFDWRKLYFLIFPAFILGAMFMIVLLPDIVLAWQR